MRKWLSGDHEIEVVMESLRMANTEIMTAPMQLINWINSTVICNSYPTGAFHKSGRFLRYFGENFKSI